VRLTVDGRSVEALPGTTVAALLFDLGAARFRTSVTGAPRGPICAMGICFECRVTIDGVAHRRSCLVAVRPGMEVVTGG
jgi:sarcosine oxidase subunit alpha